MKKTLIKGSVFVLTFFVALFVISSIVNKGNTDMTAEMKPATFPLVYMKFNGERINCLRGYKKEMDTAFQRETITPLLEGRKLNLEIEPLGNDIEKISFQVRNISGERLIEETQVLNYVESGNKITAEITIKDLIEKNKEYILVLLLTTEEGKTIRFYTKILQGEEYYTAEKLSFAKNFHEKTFDKEAAKEITRYLESNSQGDNTSFHNVNIYSTFSQITWGDLIIEKTGEVDVYLRELGVQTASIEMEYFVTLKEDKENRFYRVTEFYRVRYGKDRMYLLDFERDMTQIFDVENSPFTSNKIELGITDSEIEMAESDGGTVVAYVYGNRLYSYNAADHKFATIFSFYDKEEQDMRGMYNQNDIKILSIDETGNIRFMVYGYMNRGMHEGNVGVQIYYYNGALNTIEEEVFIPYEKTYQVLAADVKKLSYVNNSNILYLMLDGSIYAIDLMSQMHTIIVSNLSEGSFRVSGSGAMVVWQKESLSEKNRKLYWFNLNTKMQTEIEVLEDQRIKPLGFMGEDLIYGIAYKGDFAKDRLGRTIFPMYEVRIENEKRELLKNYREANIYVEDCIIEENQITMKCLQKTEDGLNYVLTADTKFLNNELKEESINRIETIAIDKFGKVVQIAVKNTIPVKLLKFLTPKEVLYEGARTIFLDNKEQTNDRYYVYGREGVIDSFTEPKNAIELADEIAGVVINEEGSYIWAKGNRLTKNQIMAIKPLLVTEEKSSVAICLDTMLKYEEVLRNTDYMLRQGETVFDILEKNMKNAQILDLLGCSLDSILYYTNRDIPVVALLNDGNAVLIIGYNELNIVIMDPITGTIYKKGMKDSAQWFQENGNTFITYIPRED